METLNLKERIKALGKLGEYILEEKPELNEIANTAHHHNKWFTPDNIKYALKAIAENFLDEKEINEWLSKYSLPENNSAKNIGLVMAGNIPLAGFHDLLCVLLTGNKAMIKLSSKDNDLLPFLLSKLVEFEPGFANSFEFIERLKAMNAVIATGSNNSSRYFEYYFGKYPHIIRKNRNSVAVLTGNETKADLIRLGDDIFLYFGLGCRSVSKLYVPEGYSFDSFFDALSPFSTVMMHDGYKNNYDYNRTLLMMNNIPHFASDFLMLHKSDKLSSPIATLYFEYYNSEEQVNDALSNLKDEIQCVVSSGNLNISFSDSVPFGKSQQPAPDNYADGVDTIRFLVSLD